MKDTTPPEISSIAANFLGLLGFQGQRREQPSHNQGTLNICIIPAEGVGYQRVDHVQYETTPALR